MKARTPASRNSVDTADSRAATASALRRKLGLAVMAVAASLAGKTRVPAGPGTFPTTTPLFMLLLVFVVLVVGGLTFLPALALGPIVEQLQMLAARLYA